MKKRTARKVVKAPPATAAAPVQPSPGVDCRMWWAWECADDYEANREASGLLLTEPNDVDAPIAYLEIRPDELTAAGAVVRAAGIFADPLNIDISDVPSDLRQYCRWWSMEETPHFLNGLLLIPAEGWLSRVDRAKRPLIRYTPFCPVRMGVLVEQYLRQRFPEDRSTLTFNAVAMFQSRDEWTGMGAGITTDAVIWRADNPHELRQDFQKGLAEAKFNAPVETLTVVPPRRH